MKYDVKTVILCTCLVALVVKNLLANAGGVRDVGSILGWEDRLRERMATNSSILAWRIPWTEEPGGLSPWGCKESDMFERLTLLIL